MPSGLYKKALHTVLTETFAYSLDSCLTPQDAASVLWRQTRAGGYKTFFMLNLVVGIKISRNSVFLGSDKPRMLFFLLINAKMPTIIGISTFVSRKNFMLN